jgi:hypothetical protein
MEHITFAVFFFYPTNLLSCLNITCNFKEKEEESFFMATSKTLNEDGDFWLLSLRASTQREQEAS